MKATKIFISALTLLGLTLVWHACTKKDHTNPNDFFEQKDNLAFFKAANGKLAKVDFLNKTIDRFKILDQSQHFASRLQSWYGAAQWNMTIVVNNKDGLYTLITPFINDRDTVTALLFAYHTDGGTKTIYRLYNKDNYKKYFSYTGDKEAATINRSTVEGWLGLFSKTHQRLKSVQEGKTLPRTIYYEWECIRYTWTYGYDPDASTGFGMSDWQCTYKIIDKGRYDEVKDELTNEPDPIPGGSGGGGTVEVWTYTEIPAKNQNIIDSLRGYKCAQEILAKIPNLDSASGALIYSIFNTNPDVDLKFGVNNNLNKDSSTDGTSTPTHVYSHYFASRIQLNPWVLQNSTQEYILGTIVHEIIHSYIDLSYNAMTINASVISGFPYDSLKIKIFKEVSTNDTHHNIIANSYVSTISNFIKNFNSNVDPWVAEAIAWGGLSKTKLWAGLRPSFRDSVLLANEQARLSGSDTTTYHAYKLRKCPIN